MENFELYRIEPTKVICYYHNKDMDGFFSGAIVKKVIPHCDMVGWDYKDPVPSPEAFEGYDLLIMIDITFPFDYLQELGKKLSIEIYDHHVSFYRQTKGKRVNFEYVYTSKLSACELAYKYTVGPKVPILIEQVGKYDTYRNVGTKEWEEETLPIKYALYSRVNKYEDALNMLDHDYMYNYEKLLNEGKVIRAYCDTTNESMMRQYSFTKEVYGGLMALCVNTNFFNSEMYKSMDTENIDIAVGFVYGIGKWQVSLRGINPDVDVSVIAKNRGGGGHKAAAGFSVHDFEDIFI